MSQGAQPNPAQVPTLTEVIELLSPTPVRDDGLNTAARPAAPAQGTLAATPIVTRGLPASQQGRSTWAPMTTVVVSSMEPVSSQSVVALADLPVLEAVVPEPTVEPVAAAARPLVPPSPPVLPAAVPLARQPTQQPVQSALIPTVTDEVKPVEPLVEPKMAPVLPEISEAQLAQRVMGDVQRQIDGMLDFRLREAMGPILARHTEALVKDLREELNRTMRDVVTRSVAQEMAKLRQR